MRFVNSVDEVGGRPRTRHRARNEVGHPARGTHRVPSRGRHAQTRAHNASLVLRALYDLGPVSRADIARLTGLTKTTSAISSPTSSATGWQENVGKGTSTGGKQPTLVALRDDARTVIVLDLGERTFHAALPNLRNGRRLAGARPPRRPRPATRPSTSSTASSTRSAEATSPILGIGIGARHRRCGRHDPLGRRPRLAGSPPRADRRGAPRLPTVVANDSRAGSPRPTCSRATSGHRTSSSSASGAASAPASSCATSHSGGTGRRRRDRPRRRRARRGGVPLRPLRLPRDRRECSSRREGGGREEDHRGGRDPRRQRRRGCPRRRPPGGRRGRREHRRPDQGARRPPHQDPGAAVVLGEPWFDATSGGAPDRPRAARRRHGSSSGGTGEDVTLLGASALLLTRELGLTVHR